MDVRAFSHSTLLAVSLLGINADKNITSIQYAVELQPMRGDSITTK